VRKFIIVAVLALPVLARAEASPLDIGGLAQLVGSKLAETKVGTEIDFGGHLSALTYLPVWVFHDAAGVQYFEMGAGGSIKQGEHFKPALTAAANAPGISSRLWSSDWARAHVTRTSLPDIWVGPAFMPDLYKPVKKWTLKESVGGLISIRIGRAGQ
jgi:hypothetical protein